jgi:hypothetical protein
MKNVIIVAGIAVLSLAAAPVALPAYVAAQSHQPAAQDTIEIPVDTIVRGPSGSEHELEQLDVANGEYKLTVEAVNQSSEHPNSDIIVRSGQSQLTVKDVERKAFSSETAEGTLTVANGEVKLYVKLGADEVFSGGVKVMLTHVPPETPPEEPEDPEEPEKPEEPETPEPEVPETLPETGAGGIVTTVATLSTLGGYLGHRFINRRK